jgi:hypothetical protein
VVRQLDTTDLDAAAGVIDGLAGELGGPHDRAGRRGPGHKGPAGCAAGTSR